ncbi:MAG: acyl-CoA/acyl-ACP dehydrogenase [Planctomycetes bacterium]|nr:acyl-CoA/acyl-ACP dehydrogenase [Planctomycetota bacterium]
MSSSLQELTEQLAVHADQDDRSRDWPVEVIQTLGEFDCWRWGILRVYGGDELGSAEMIERFEAVARGSMTAVLIYTQHDAAADLIVRGDNGRLRDRLGPRLAAGEILLTVGISQLTTSRQDGEPAMKVCWDGSTATFDGLMPWVTSAAEADFIVTAGVLPDGQQLLAAMPTDTPGLEVESPLELAALQASCTSVVRCHNAPLDAAWVIRGPVAKALALRAPVRPLVVSAAGIGLAGAMVSELKRNAPRRGRELRALLDPLVDRYQTVRRQLYDAADLLSDPTAEAPAGRIRAAVNDLVLRLAVGTVTFAKGTGYLAGKPAQRLAREALFFLVWSIPEDVQTDTLRRFLGPAT